MSAKEIAIGYFEDNPNQKEDVIKAYYAWHIPHFRIESDAHHFPGVLRASKCEWCGRTREDVRHDNLPAACQRRPDVPDVVGVIMEEERKAFHLLQSAPLQVHRVVSKHGMTGESLAILHHTHGYDPETVACIVDVPADCMVDYEAAMKVERERSRDSLKREQIMAQI